jgi:hypothetical protein
LYTSIESLSVVAESLAPYRGSGAFRSSMLVRAGLPLAISELQLSDDVEVVDLDEPAVLVAEGLRPSRVATRQRSVTQRIAAGLFERHPDAAALLWWSTLEASWLNATIFDRAAASLSVRRTEKLTPDHPLVREAAAFLALRVT